MSESYGTNGLRKVTDSDLIKDAVKGIPNGNVEAVDSALASKIPAAQKGAAGGVAELDEHGLVLSSQLPSYVDDVADYEGAAAFPAQGETGKIYVDTTDNRTYRWSGSGYVEISPSLALGETGATAYRGDRGAAAYSHASAKGQAYGSGLYKITTNAEGHVVAAVPATMDDLAGLGAAASGHTHSASDVTGGALAVERGGTGASTAAGAASAIVDGNAIAPASVAATGAVTGASVGDADGTLADLRDSVSQASIAGWYYGIYAGGYGFLVVVPMLRPAASVEVSHCRAFTGAGWVDVALESWVYGANCVVLRFATPQYAEEGRAYLVDIGFSML